jgi:hypothetical protein
MEVNGQLHGQATSLLVKELYESRISLFSDVMRMCW